MTLAEFNAEEQIRSKRGRAQTFDFYQFWVRSGALLDIDLGFDARSLTLDNATSQFVYVPSVGRFVPPHTYGVTMLLTGTRRGRIQWFPPDGESQPDLVVGQELYALFRTDFPTAVGDAGQTLSPRGAIPLVPLAPVAAVAGAASAQIIAANPARRGLVVENLSADTVSFGQGQAAVLNSGITLLQNGVWQMDAYLLTTDAVFAISSGAASALAVQEYE